MAKAWGVSHAKFILDSIAWDWKPYANLSIMVATYAWNVIYDRGLQL